tara:strand:- start:560 stop:754 length:195 start_codon:yes stop_codon:yes gene_type:complete
MRFTQWAEGQTHQAVAVHLNVSRSFITHVLNGSRKPSIHVMRRIRDCSEGQVTADELLDEFTSA